MYTPTKSGAGIIQRAVATVSAVARKILSPRNQVMIEAGYLTECMSFTPKFDEAVRLIALEKWGEEIEEAAKAEVAELTKEAK